MTTKPTRATPTEITTILSSLHERIEELSAKIDALTALATTKATKPAKVAK